jgi:4-hydroxy-4-methyl-2-oxoglutarate aldolase
MLQVKRNFSRPAEALVKRLARAPTGWVVDANGRRGALDYRIRALTSAKKFCGVALTVWTRACDNLSPYAAIQYAKPGDVLVIATDGYEQASVTGDVMVGMAKNQGISAVVTDGLVRDIEGLNAVGIPVCARGLSPNSPQKDGPGAIGLPVSLGGVAVNAGDVILGDQDGVVVVAREALEEVAAALAEIEVKEARMDALVRDGARLPPGLEKLISEKGVKLLD